MQQKQLYGSLKVLGYVILLLMATAITYAFFIAVTNWSGIGV